MENRLKWDIGTQVLIIKGPGKEQMGIIRDSQILDGRFCFGLNVPAKRWTKIWVPEEFVIILDEAGELIYGQDI